MSHIGNDAVIDAQRDELDAGDCNKCGAGFGFEIIFCMACGNCGVHCSCKKNCVNCLMFTCTKHN